MVKIVYDFPIILTSDAAWIKAYTKSYKVEKGAIWVLPPDAVLLFPPKPTKKGR